MINEKNCAISLLFNTTNPLLWFWLLVPQIILFFPTLRWILGVSKSRHLSPKYLKCVMFSKCHKKKKTRIGIRDTWNTLDMAFVQKCPCFFDILYANTCIAIHISLFSLHKIVCFSLWKVTPNSQQTKFIVHPTQTLPLQLNTSQENPVVIYGI